MPRKGTPKKPRKTVALVASPDTMLPWVKVYAMWLACQPTNPAVPVRARQAQLLSGAYQPPSRMRQVENGVTFRAYVAELTASQIMRARGLYEQGMARTVEQHLELRDAAHVAGDYKEFVKYSNPVLDRIWPKHDERAPPKAQVVIHMAPGSFAARATQPTGEETVIEEQDVVVISGPEAV